MVSVLKCKTGFARSCGIFFMLSLFTFLASCANNTGKNQTGDTLDRIRRTGIVEACTVVDPPFTIKDSKTGKFSGVYVDALNLIAQKMNAKVIWHESTWGNVTADLASGRCDVLDASIYANIPRAMAVAFTSPPLAYMGLSALVRKDDPRFAHAKDVMEFDKPDITVVLATGGGADYFAKENFKHAKVRRVDVESGDLMRFVVEVSSHRADVAFAAQDDAERYAKQHPEVTLLFGNDPFSMEPIAWAVRQDDLKWLHFIETALQFLNTQGTMTQLEKQYNAHWIHLIQQYKLQ